MIRTWWEWVWNGEEWVAVEREYDDGLPYDDRGRPATWDDPL